MVATETRRKRKRRRRRRRRRKKKKNINNDDSDDNVDDDNKTDDYDKNDNDGDDDDYCNTPVYFLDINMKNTPDKMFLSPPLVSCMLAIMNRPGYRLEVTVPVDWALNSNK